MKYKSVEKIEFEKFKSDIIAAGYLSKIEVDKIVSRKCGLSFKKNLMCKYIELKGFKLNHLEDL
jgi:hypothetical protein